MRRDKSNNSLKSIISISVIILSLVIPLVFILRPKKSSFSSLSVKMYVYDNLVYDVLLPNYDEYILNNGSNKVKINGYEVSMVESNCNNSVCIRTGKISREGESIVCLPNHISVLILTEDVDIFI